MATAQLTIDISGLISGLTTAVTAVRGAAEKVRENVNFQLNLDGKEASKQVDTLSNSFKTLKGTTASDIERIRNSMALLVLSGKQGSDEFKRLQSELKELTKQAAGFDDAMKQVDDSIKTATPSGLIGQFQQLGSGIKSAFSADSISGLISGLGALSPAVTGIVAGFGAIAGGIKSFAEGAISGGKEFETYETQLTTLMGSTVAAKDRIKELAQFGAETPFELPEIVKAEKVLLGFGLTGQKALQMTGQSSTQLRSIIGDVAAGTGQKFDELALTFGKFSSGATGEAISRLQELGIVTREELKDVGISFSKSGELTSPLDQALTKSLEIAKSKFGGGMSALAQTAEGLTSTINDAVSMGVTEAGAPIFSAYKQILKVTADLLSSGFVKDAIEGIKTFLQDILDGINSFVDYATPKIKPFADFIGGVLVLAFKVLSANISYTWAVFKNIVGTLFSSILDALAPLGEALSELGKAFGASGESSISFSEVMKGVGEIVGYVGKAVITLLIQPFRLMVSVMSDAIKTVAGWVTGLQETTGASEKAGQAIQSFGGFVVFVKQVVNGFVASVREAGTILYDFWQNVKSLDFAKAMDTIANAFGRIKNAAATEMAKTFSDEAKKTAESLDNMIREFDKKIEDLKNNRKTLTEAELKAQKEELTASVKQSEIDERNKTLLTTKIANILRGKELTNDDNKAKETAYQLTKAQFEKEKELLQNQERAYENSLKEQSVKRGTKLTEEELKSIEDRKLLTMEKTYAAALKLFSVTKDPVTQEYKVNFQGLTDKDKGAVTEITKTVSGLFDAKTDFAYNIQFKATGLSDVDKDIEKQLTAIKKNIKSAESGLKIEPSIAVSFEEGAAQINSVKATLKEYLRQLEENLGLATDKALKDKLRESIATVKESIENVSKDTPAILIKYEFERKKLDLALISDEAERKIKEQLLSLEKSYAEDLLKYGSNAEAKSKLDEQFNEKKSNLITELNRLTDRESALGYSAQEEMLKSFLDTTSSMQDKARADEQAKRETEYKKQSAEMEKQLASGVLSLRDYQNKVGELKEKANADSGTSENPEWVNKLNRGLSNTVQKALPTFQRAVDSSRKGFENAMSSTASTMSDKLNAGLGFLTDLSEQGLVLAAKTASEGGNALKAFGNVVLRGLADILSKQLVIAITGAIFTEAQTKGLLGLATGAVLTAALTFMFNQAMSAIGLKKGTESVGDGDGRLLKINGATEDQYLTRLDYGEAVIPAAQNHGKNREAIRYMISGGAIENFHSIRQSTIAITKAEVVQGKHSNHDVVESITNLRKDVNAVEKAVGKMSAITMRKTEHEIKGKLRMDGNELVGHIDNEYERQSRRE
jgi:hypothetical protein